MPKKPKTVKGAKNSLKFKAQPKSGLLSVRVGVKKFKVPVEARLLSNGGYMFLSFSSSSELYRVSDGNLQPMGFDADGTEAYSALNPSRRRGRRRAPAELPDEVAKALARVPSGYKVGYDADGNARLVRKRVRRRK